MDTLAKLQVKYIKIHKDPMEHPEDYELDVRSFCVLSHAAFEEFIENICLEVLNEACEQYTTTKRFSYSTLCLLHFSQSESIDNDKWNDNQTLYDYFRGRLTNIKSQMSNEIMNNNHGIGLKYLKKMLLPLGLDLPTDTILLNSLKNLAKYRGGYAHTSKRNCKVITPENADMCVDDVLNMCIELFDRARKISYFKA